MINQKLLISIRSKIIEYGEVPSVSGVQCLTDNILFQGLDYATMADSADDFRIVPKQQTMMDKLVETAKINNENNKLMIFPPHRDVPVK